MLKLVATYIQVWILRIRLEAMLAVGICVARGTWPWHLHKYGGCIFQHIGHVSTV